MKYFPKKMIGLAGVIMAAFLAVGCSQQIMPVDGPSDLSRTNAFLPTTMDSASNFAVYSGGDGITNSGINTLINGDAGTTGTHLG